MLARLSQPAQSGTSDYAGGTEHPPETPAYKEAKEIRLLLAEAKRAHKAIAEASPEERGPIEAFLSDAERRLRAYHGRLRRSDELALSPKIP